MTEAVVIIGAGGGSRDVLDIFQAWNTVQPVYEVRGFVVDTEYARAGITINDLPVLGGFDWLDEHRADVRVICGVGAPELRRQLVSRTVALGASFCTVIHPSVQKTRWLQVGDGTSIAAGCILTNRVKIGDHVQINVGCTLSHDVSLGDFVTLSPGVHLAGNIAVEEGAFVGIGVSCIEKRRIGAWSTVGAGAVIVEDVPPNSTVVGVPAKVIKRKPEGWHLA